MMVLDLFSGIGGFSLGLKRAGMQTVAFCEIEEFPRKVLAKHWPNVPIHEDIRKLDGRQYRGTVDVVCGGFPCQPFSAAGKQGGRDDDRDLWPEMFRVIREVQPTWVIGENVAGFVNMELDRTLSDLEGAGYACQTFDIPAVGVDAPHIRHRVWIVANASERRCSEQGEGENQQPRRTQAVGAGEGMADTESHRRNKGSGQSHREHTEKDRERQGNFGGIHAGNVADTASERCREAGPSIERPATRFTGSSVVSNSTGSEQIGWRDRSGRWQRSTFESQLLAGIRSEWHPEPAVGRVANGIPQRVDRLKGLGNAVVPQIPEIIGRAIMAQG